MAAIADEDPNVVLAPRECHVSVLFCDLRGFSRRSEQMSDNLPELLARVSEALGVTTGEVLDKGGVIGDFHGDAAMGFWGWPLEQANAPAQACRAALAIRQAFCDFAGQTQHPLNDFQIGLGIASGQAVAGKIGTVDQVKVTAFGPVVNLAARLESLSGRWQAPVLLDGPTAEAVRAQLPASEGRCRRLAVVRPFGIDSTIEIFELLPPESPLHELTDADLAQYEAALQAFVEGRWGDAKQLLTSVPDTDRAKSVLQSMLAQNGGQVPDDWPGYVVLEAK
jgi:adenylate cyclase